MYSALLPKDRSDVLFRISYCCQILALPKRTQAWVKQLGGAPANQWFLLCLALPCSALRSLTILLDYLDSILFELH